MVFNLLQKGKKSKVVDTVPASMYRTGMYTGIEMTTFCTSLNTGRTGQFQAIPISTRHTDRYRKKL